MIWRDFKRSRQELESIANDRRLGKVADDRSPSIGPGGAKGGGEFLLYGRGSKRVRTIFPDVLDPGRQFVDGPNASSAAHRMFGRKASLVGGDQYGRPAP